MEPNSLYFFVLDRNLIFQPMKVSLLNIYIVSMSFLKESFFCQGAGTSSTKPRQDFFSPHFGISSHLAVLVEPVS